MEDVEEYKSTVRLLFMKDLQEGEEAASQIIPEAEKIGFKVHHCSTSKGALALLKSQQFHVLITALGRCKRDAGISLIEASLKNDPRIFNCMFSFTASDDAETRLHCTQKGAHMVTCSLDALLTVLRRIFSFHTTSLDSPYKCCWCGQESLSEDQMWEHGPLFHINTDSHVSDSYMCPICNKKRRTLPVHLHNNHGPPGRGEGHNENFEPDQIYAFSLVVVRRKDGRFLVVQEFANKGYWLPGGRVDPGEGLIAAGVRETAEEAGVDITIDGVLQIQYTPHRGMVRLRVIFLAHPNDEDQLPKSIPDYESAGATWIKVSQLKNVNWRGREPAKWFPYVDEGKPVYPLSILRTE